MNNTCPRCHAVTDPNSRFCTNCGTVIAVADPYPQSSGQSQPAMGAQVPPWASSNPNAGGYQQQQQWGAQSGPAAGNAGGSLGFGGTNDALAKKIITYLILGIIAIVGLLILLGLLAVLFAPLRWLFCIFLFVVVVVPFFLYSIIRSYIRRTVGRLWWF